jgi:hypothetical protein
MINISAMRRKDEVWNKWQMEDIASAMTVICFWPFSNLESTFGLMV